MAIGFIDYDTFQTGIKRLCEVWMRLDGEGTRTWEDVKLIESVCLQKRIHLLSGHSRDFPIVKGI